MNAVRKLLEGLDGGGHTNMKDNFFTNIKLFKYLEARGIYATGTIRNNRIGIPKVLAQTKVFSKNP